MGRRKSQNQAARDIAIIAAEVSGGQNFHGTEDGPGAILSRLGSRPDWVWDRQLQAARWQELYLHLDRVSEASLYLAPLESVPPPSYAALGRTLAQLKDQVEQSLRREERVLSLGGDHSIAMGSLAGALAAYGEELLVLWVDAHGDFSTPARSPSGNAHGMPLAALCGEFRFEGEEWNWLGGSLKGSQVIHVGGRAFDDGERELMKSRGFRMLDMSRIHDMPLATISRQILERLAQRPSLKLWISFDIDALSDAFTPGTGTPEPSGLDPTECLDFLSDLTSSPQCVGVEIAELNPKLDASSGMTCAIATDLALEALKGFRRAILTQQTPTKRTAS